MADIFISYAREDRARADQIARGLQSMGLEVFWDTEIPPGHTWADYIEAKLTQCRAVIVLWSQHSVSSQWVREEARMGREMKRLIPVLLDGTPSPFGFGEVQAADLSNWNGDANNPEWLRFSQAAFNRARDGAAAPAPPPVAAAAPVAAPPPPQWSQPQPAYAAASAGVGPSMSPIDYIKKCFRLYVDGKGRARRAEFWWWVLFTVIVGLVAGIIDLAFGINPYTQQPNSQVVGLLANLAVLAPSVAVLSRRLHDIGQSGWFAAAVFGAYLVGGFFVGLAQASMNAGIAGLGVIMVLVAFIGQIVIGAIPGVKGPNQYGPDPKA
jgi:uncharacterized membrane protein YhaH (DUF805 family)